MLKRKSIKSYPLFFELLQAQYPMLTRLLMKADNVGHVMIGILDRFKWRHASLLLHEHAENSGRGHSHCSFALSALNRYGAGSIGAKEKYKFRSAFFDELNLSHGEIKTILNDAKNESRSEFFIYLFLFCF